MAPVTIMQRVEDYVSVTQQLPTEFNADGWSRPFLVCLDHEPNIYPHAYIRGRGGRPGYWLQIGAPHPVTNVTHFRDYPAGPRRPDDPAC